MIETRTQTDAPAGTPRRTRPRVQNEIVAALARSIATGAHPPGTRLPREQDLCARFGVSRTVIRETLKVLESKGLLRGKPRVGTFVRAKAEWNLLDPDILAWFGADFLDEALLRSVLEARRAIEPMAAALAAERATLQEVADLDEAWRQMAGAADRSAFTAADLRFHALLLGASRNPVFAQFSGLIHAALEKAFDASNRAVPDHADTLRLHRDLVEALRLRDAAGARVAVEAILARAEHDLARVLDAAKG